MSIGAELAACRLPFVRRFSLAAEASVARSRDSSDAALASGGPSGLRSSTDRPTLFLRVLLSSSPASTIFLTAFLPTFTVVTVGFFKAGSAYNVIPGEVHIGGTTRTTTPENRKLAQKRIKEICDGAAQIDW